MLLIVRIQIQHEVRSQAAIKVIVCQCLGTFQMRMVEQTSSCMTQLHFDLLMDLFKMSTSHYTQVRSYICYSTSMPLHFGKVISHLLATFSACHMAVYVIICSIFTIQIRIRAQSTLSHLVDNYLYSCRIMIPHIVPLLANDPAISHEQFKVKSHQ